ncbi:MAG: hypothetical protein DMF59_02930 [Acidobacteria bacterium]|nr:MAG: hypothetical protein DMF59_02930 [Acidobacteriota bacterium]
MRTRTLSAFCLGLLLLLATRLAAEESKSPGELLTRYVAELRATPDDQALREEIIRLELTLNPAPTIPEEATQYFVTARTFQKEGDAIIGYELATSAHEFAIAAYKQALLIAPWWAEAYDGLAVSLESTGRVADAANARRLSGAARR